MKIVIACDSFKGCMTSQEVCRNIEKGIHRANPKHHCVLYPMADGGEGTAECFAQVMQGDMITMESLDAYGKKITVQYARGSLTLPKIIDFHISPLNGLFLLLF